MASDHPSTSHLESGPAPLESTPPSVSVGSNEIASGFADFKSVKSAMTDSKSDSLNNLGFYDSQTIGQDFHIVGDNRSQGPGEGQTQAEREAVEANSKTVGELFPNPNDQELRDAAYRELMRHECVEGYPPDTPGAKQDRQLIEERGATKQVQDAIKERAKQRTDQSCVPVS